MVLRENHTNIESKRIISQFSYTYAMNKKLLAVVTHCLFIMFAPLERFSGRKSSQR